MVRVTASAAALIWAGQVAAADCAGDVAALRRLARDPHFPLRWTEVGMDDGKPLLLVLREGVGALHLRFDKAREGLWAEGTGSVCAEGGALEMRFGPGQLNPGPAAHWLLRQALQAGGRFVLTRGTAGELGIAATGWSGRFVRATDADVTRP